LTLASLIPIESRKKIHQET